MTNETNAALSALKESLNRLTELSYRVPDALWNEDWVAIQQTLPEAIALLEASQRETPAAEEWSRAGLTPREMWDEIQIIRKITGDDGTHGAPHILVQQLADQRYATDSSILDSAKRAGDGVGLVAWLRSLDWAPSLIEAEEFERRLALAGAPVADAKGVRGVVSREEIEKAFRSADTKEYKPSWVADDFQMAVKLGLDAVFALQLHRPRNLGGEQIGWAWKMGDSFMFSGIADKPRDGFPIYRTPPPCLAQAKSGMMEAVQKALNMADGFIGQYETQIGRGHVTETRKAIHAALAFLKDDR